MNINHLVMFSGGVCSWAAAKRVVGRHGMDGVVLLFADTYIEDDDTYRFLIEASANVMHAEVPPSLLPLRIPPLTEMEERKHYLDSITYPGLTRIADGRNPWEVMRDHKCIASARMDMCSRELKRDLLDAWRNKHCDVRSATIHVGLLWDEGHRVERLKSLCKPWIYESPMSERPWVSKNQMFQWLASEGIRRPRLYDLGFAHNNCGGMCVKAGQAQFEKLFRFMPERYLWHESQEESLRQIVGDYSVMKCRKGGGPRKTLSMRTFRERIMNDKSDFDQFDLGGCGCAVE